MSEYNEALQELDKEFPGADDYVLAAIRKEQTLAKFHREDLIVSILLISFFSGIISVFVWVILMP